MSFTQDDEERETFASFMDQLQLLKNSLQSARDKAEVSLDLAKAELIGMRERIEYTLQEY